MKSSIAFILSFMFSGLLIAQSWEVLDLPHSTRYDDVFFLDENVGWAINAKGYTVSKSIDGGETWNWQFQSNEEHLRNIVFLDENRGFLGTLTSSFYKTIDGGQTWTLENIPGVEAICGLDVAGNNTVYGCGAYFEPAYIIKSTDGGENWDFIDMSAYATGLVEVLFWDENTGLASGKNDEGGMILKTIDGGQTWTEIYNSGLPGEFVWKMQRLFSNSDAFFASVQSLMPYTGKLAKSLDGGQTWTTREILSNNPGSGFDPMIQGVGFITENHGWASGYFSTLLETHDGGVTWDDIEGGAIGSVNRFQVFNENLVFASGKRVYKYTNSLGVNEYANEVPKGLDIIVSPNPIKDKLNISIQFERKDHMVITLHDEQGRLVKQLSRETITEAGEKVYTFDFPYSAGIYFVHFHDDLGARSIKVMKR